MIHWRTGLSALALAALTLLAATVGNCGPSTESAAAATTGTGGAAGMGGGGGAAGSGYLAAACQHLAGWYDCFCGGAYGGEGGGGQGGVGGAPLLFCMWDCDVNMVTDCSADLSTCSAAALDALESCMHALGPDCRSYEATHGAWTCFQASGCYTGHAAGDCVY